MKRGAALLLVGSIAAVACSGGGDEGGGEGDETEYEGFALVEEVPGEITVDTGEFTVAVATDPLLIAAASEGEDFFTEAEGAAGGLYVVRGGERIDAVSAEPRTVTNDRVELRVTFADDTTGTLSIVPERPGTVAFALVPDDPADITHWGDTLASPDDELIYGLTERIVTGQSESEIFPAAVGSLDRRGEVVEMAVAATIAGYAPFHQSSRGYGLLVDGTMPGRYDVAAADPSLVDIRFELDPDQPTGRFYLFHGPDHAGILDEYSALTGRPFAAPDAIFRHWQGRDEWEPGTPTEVDGVAINPTIADMLEMYEELDLPAGVLHFDRPWASGTEGFGALEFDPERFPNPEEMLALLEERGWTSQVWVSPWALDERGAEAAEAGLLAPDSDRFLDLTNPDAVAFLQEDLREFLEGPEGTSVDALFLDRGDRDLFGVSDTDAVWADGRGERQVHNEYPSLFAEAASDVITELRPDDGWAVSRSSWTGNQDDIAMWGGDTHSRNGIILPEAEPTGPSTDLDLRSVLISIQRMAFMGVPYWGSDIGGYSLFSDRELFARWIEVGAVSPLMRFHGNGSRFPWAMHTDPARDEEMIDIYGRYVRLHHALGDYFEDLAAEAHETGLTIVRPLVFAFPDEEGALDRWDEWMLGEELLAAPVWESGAVEREVYFPSGTWVDFWDREHVVEGPTTETVDAPLDTLPLYVAEGSDLLDIEPPE